MVLGALYSASGASAHPLDTEECTEASNFIKNAAMSRENGMDGLTFMAKMLADFLAIRSFPIELRWLVQDLQDEELLIKAVSEVFGDPRAPELHQRAFLEQCLAQSSPDPTGERIILNMPTEAPK